MSKRQQHHRYELHVLYREWQAMTVRAKTAASSAMLGESTSPMRFETRMPHPVAGNGLFIRLDLPITLEREELADCANYLNLYESTTYREVTEIATSFLAMTGSFWRLCVIRRIEKELRQDTIATHSI